MHLPIQTIYFFQQMQHLMSTRQLTGDKQLLQNISEECIKHLAASSQSKLLWNLASQD